MALARSRRGLIDRLTHFVGSLAACVCFFGLAIGGLIGVLR